MIVPIVLLAAAAAEESPHDTGVHQVAALSARTAFVFMCLGLCWGTFTSTGWLRRLTGRQATRSSHMVFITLALGFATIHALAFLFMEDEHIAIADLVIPMHTDELTLAVGIVALEVMFAIALSNLAQRWLRQRLWLRLHRFGYVAVTLGVVHSVAGAMADGNLAALWMFGLAVAVPTVLVVALRFLPTRFLTGAGLLKVER